VTHIALCIPALNEEQGIQRTAVVAREAIDAGLVHSAYVLDGGSSDGTAVRARDAGIEVLSVPLLLPELGPVLGKGDSLFRAVHSIEADWYVFLDADLGNISLAHIAALVAPIGTVGVQFVKGGFVRVDEHGVPREVPGGRVTEEYGRPLLQSVAPELAEFSQPLSGQVAIAGPLAKSLNFVTGYGIEIAMLIDVWRHVGAAGIVEADMGLVNNRWKPDDALSDVIADVVAGAAQRNVEVAHIYTDPLPVLKERTSLGKR
jgi:glucosyl-3-phosphoglycerate synthase